MEAEKRTMWNCTRCGWQWFSPNNNKPVLCAKCKNPYWSIPRKINIMTVEVDEDDDKYNNKNTGI